MAEQKVYLTESGAGFYRTRMLSAGDPITLSGPEARLQLALRNVVAKKPRAAKAPEPQLVEPIPTVDEVLAAEVVAPKRGRRKKAAQ